MFGRLLTKVADYPPLWDTARRIIEANHRAERHTIRLEFADISGSVLDVPCGTGIFSPLFDQLSYTGLDATKRYVEHARRKHPDKHFLVGDALGLPFDSGRFDGVLVVGFLHHLDDSQVDVALAEVRRVLRPGGRFVLIEDCPTRKRWNLAGRLLQSLDAGGRIRSVDWYQEVLSRSFRLLRRSPLRAGLWDYEVYVLD